MGIFQALLCGIQESIPPDLILEVADRGRTWVGEKPRRCAAGHRRHMSRIIVDVEVAWNLYMLCND
jgi:hypothetical protein